MFPWTLSSPIRKVPPTYSPRPNRCRTPLTKNNMSTFSPFRGSRAQDPPQCIDDYRLSPLTPKSVLRWVRPTKMADGGCVVNTGWSTFPRNPPKTCHPPHTPARPPTDPGEPTRPSRTTPQEPPSSPLQDPPVGPPSPPTTTTTQTPHTPRPHARDAPGAPERPQDPPSPMTPQDPPRTAPGSPTLAVFCLVSASDAPQLADMLVALPRKRDAGGKEAKPQDHVI